MTFTRRMARRYHDGNLRLVADDEEYAEVMSAVEEGRIAECEESLDASDPQPSSPFASCFNFIARIVAGVLGRG